MNNAIDAASLLGVTSCASWRDFRPPARIASRRLRRIASQFFLRCWNTPEQEGQAGNGELDRDEYPESRPLGAIFEVVPQKNLGLNFDPSHLLWQDIDYIYAVEKFADRIFHTHGKDTEINDMRKRTVGNQGSGWWRYVIPGLGRVKWGEYIAALRRHGYNGVISIEHEDGAVEREEGFLIGKKYLEQFIAY